MKLSVLLYIVIHLVPFVLLYTIYNTCIYKVYGFRKLSKIIKENDLTENEKKRLKTYFYLFWWLIYVFVLYIFVLYVIHTGHWTEI